MGSFRLKLVLASVLVSGLVLAGFGIGGFAAIRRIGLERIDRELQALGDAQMRKIQPPGHWARFDESLVALYGTESTQYLIRVTGHDGRALYVSPHWPAGLAAAALPPRPPRSEPPGLDPGPPLGPPEGLERPEGGPPPRRFARPPPDMGPPRPLDVVRCAAFTASAGTRTWRLVALRNADVDVVVGVDLAAFYAEVARVRNAASVAVPLALLALAAGGWWLASQALRPVRTLARVAGGITARDLSQRVPAGQADREFRALIDVINGMLDRLERSFRQATRFSADAAHELKTPLTILQGQLEQALQSAPSSTEQERVAGLLEEVQRLTAIVRKLLLLAQADAGQLRLSREPVDLGREVADVVEDIHVLGQDLTVTHDAPAGTLVQADPDLLRQVLRNLATNAVKYNRERGTVDLRLRREGDRVALTVTNTVNATAQFDPQRLFERFYRGDAAHGRRTDGLGLGLSLSREIARAHGGDLAFDPAGDGKAAFTLRLPGA